MAAGKPKPSSFSQLLKTLLHNCYNYCAERAYADGYHNPVIREVMISGYDLSLKVLWWMQSRLPKLSA